MEQVVKPLTKKSNSVKVSQEYVQNGQTIQELMEDVFAIFLKRKSSES